jgi:hypothetical protein
MSEHTDEIKAMVDALRVLNLLLLSRLTIESEETMLCEALNVHRLLNSERPIDRDWLIDALQQVTLDLNALTTINGNTNYLVTTSLRA